MVIYRTCVNGRNLCLCYQRRNFTWKNYMVYQLKYFAKREGAVAFIKHLSVCCVQGDFVDIRETVKKIVDNFNSLQTI